MNLSDLAAKGAVPRAYMLDLMLPKTVTEAWIAGFARGLAEDQHEYGVHLIGGDTDSTPGPVTIAIMAFGDVATGRMLRRGGARAGDRVFVTGTIGDAALGLTVLRGQLKNLDMKAADFLVGRYRLPRPRVRLGPQLIGMAHAALDVSDGLLADLGHLCEASELAAVIEAAQVPLSTAVRAVLATHSGHISTVLTGGDDYEILFTAPPEAVNELTEWSRTFDVPVTARPTAVTIDRETTSDHGSGRVRGPPHLRSPRLDALLSARRCSFHQRRTESRSDHQQHDEH